MFNLAQAMQAIDDALTTKPVDAALNWNTKVPFDPALVGQLIGHYRALNERFESLGAQLEGDSQAAEAKIRECAEALHKLRHDESLRLYPVIARGLSSDPIKSAHSVPAAMQAYGWRVIPVNPHADELLGEKGSTVYGVLGLVSDLEEILPYEPCMVGAVLLPWEDRIIYDSLLTPSKLRSFGQEIVRSPGTRTKR